MAYDSTYTRYLEYVNLQTESRKRLSETGVGGMRTHCLMGTEFQFCNVKSSTDTW